MSLKNNPEALNAIGFAERVLTLLHEGARNGKRSNNDPGH